MRVRFFVPDDEQETARYLALVRQIDDFWKEFRATAPQLEAGSGDGFANSLRAWLGRIEPGLGLELSLEADGTRRCHVLPVEGEQLLPLAELFVERAPERLPWEFSVRRPSLPLRRCLEIVRRDFARDLSSARARVGVGRGHALEVVIGSDQFQGAEDEAALDAANALVARLLGDELFDAWVQQVSVVPQPKPSPLAVVGQQSNRLSLAISELQPALLAAIQGVVRGLPDVACHTHCERADWVLFELGDDERPSDGEAGEDLARPAPLADLLMAATMCPEMLRCHLSEGLFASERFSRFGEVFCYLKLELPQQEMQGRVEERVRLEQLIDRTLVPGQLGCVAGSGVGSQYVYIVLALVHLEAATERIIKKLRQEGIGHNSWLLYCDSAWRDEWTGIWPQTPSPFSAEVHSAGLL